MNSYICPSLEDSFEEHKLNGAGNDYPSDTYGTKEHMRGLVKIIRTHSFPANIGKALLYDLRCGGLRSAIYFSLPYFVHEIFKKHPHLDNLCDTAWVYGFLRVFRLREEFAAPLAIAIGNGTEFMQRQGWFAGTYDPKDFLYFTLGGLAAYATDKSANALVRLLRRRRHYSTS